VHPPEGVCHLERAAPIHDAFGAEEPRAKRRDVLVSPWCFDDLKKPPGGIAQLLPYSGARGKKQLARRTRLLAREIACLAVRF
jgi:hypothetical protein